MAVKLVSVIYHLHSCTLNYKGCFSCSSAWEKSSALPKVC